MPYSDQTIKDCRLVTGSQTIRSLFDFFNHTRTPGGAVALEDLLRDKKNKVQEIFEVQAATRFVMDHLHALDPQLQNSDIYYLQEYFRLTLNTIPGDMMAGLLSTFNLSSDPTFHLVRSNIVRLSIFLRSVQKLTVVLVLPMPVLLAEISGTLNRCLNHEVIKHLMAADIHERSRSYFLKTDSFLRENFQSDFNELLGALYRLEAFVSVAKTVLKEKLAFPSVGESGTIELTGLYHPLVKGAVKNDLQTDDKTRLLFLTGANMAGKSTFLRAVGSIVALAHAGLPVPASFARMPFYDEIVVHINAEDNIEKGYSKFYNEVSIVKSVLNKSKAGENCFAIFDEIFSGTNPADAVECCGIVFEKMKNMTNGLLMISSHNILLAGEALQDHVQYNYIQTELTDNKPRFTYRLMPGINEVKLGSILFNQL